MRQFLGRTTTPCLSQRVFSRALSSGARQLAGRNIFQLRAQAAAQETPPAPTKEKAPKQNQDPQQQVDLASIPLPTSDEDERMLRIRHSVSGAVWYGAMGTARNTQAV